MKHNPILEEIYAARKKLLDDAGGDLHRYVQEARERALASGRPLVNLARKPDSRAEEDLSNQRPSLDDIPPNP